MDEEPPVESVATERAATERPAPPYAALFPNLDKLSPSVLRKGSLGRRRLVRALLIFAAAIVVIAAVIVLSALLQ